MKLLIKIEELNNYKSRDKIPLQCENSECNKTFYQFKSQVQAAIKDQTGKRKMSFCSWKCGNSSRRTQFTKNCKNCEKEFKTVPSLNGSFCSHSCAATYTNPRRKFHYTRSKLEFWLEDKLSKIYPNLLIMYNDTLAIKSELDIYIPSLKLAFELNGPFHYEPIFGLEVLTKTEQRDKRKMLICAENNIELCVIDTSKQKYVKDSTCQPFLIIITSIIDSKLVACPDNSSGDS